MSYSDEDIGNAFINFLIDDNVDAMVVTWGKLRAVEYANQLGLKDDEFERFIYSNYESMTPAGEESMQLVLNVMALASGKVPAEIGKNILETVAEEVTRSMPLEDAHKALMLLWNKRHFGRVEVSAIYEFLRMREDAETLIFWNAPWSEWGMGDGWSYSAGPWTERAGSLFSIACLFLEDDLIEALGGLFTPNMTIAVHTTTPNPFADMMSCTVIEMAIWTTSASQAAPGAAPETDNKLKRRRVIDLLLEGGASPEAVELPRSAYLPSRGDPMLAAKQSGNEEAVESILHARNVAQATSVLATT